MRLHGTLTKWNDDRGFGFITPAKDTGDLFVHISAFPRDGVRPRLNELISFEVEAGPDGRQRAVRVMRPGQGLAKRPPVPRERHRSRDNKAGGVAATLLVIAGVAAYAYFQSGTGVGPSEPSGSDVSRHIAAPSGQYSCDGRTMCSQMTSCAEARYFIRHCPNTQMDGDGDGVPCESQWCN
jgi:cold shock CspA family protein